MPRVLIAIPTFESIYPDTFKALWDMDKGGNEVLFEFVRGYDCATARNNIAQKALSMNVDYVFMVDNDVTVPKDALVNMISHNVDVVSGYYVHRFKTDETSNKTNICKRGEMNYTMQYTGDELATLRNNGEYLIRVHGGGMGCVLIRTSVFNRISYPYYAWRDYGNGKMLSEDLHFCEQCKAEHIKIYVDTRVQCGHMVRYIYTV